MNLRILRNLAKSDRWQIIYNRAKELGTIKLFDNDSDLTKAQILFLYYLELYSSLYRDLASHEPYISEAVIDDEIRCYDEKTEILTDQGWKYFKDLDRTEKVATLNPENDIIKYQKPIKYIDYSYNGEMFKLKTKQFDLVTTPNHSHFVGINVDKKLRWTFKKSFEIFNNFWLVFKNTGLWKGQYQRYFTLDSVTKKLLVPNRWYKNLWFKFDKKTNFIKIKMEDWLEFLGWYLSEGSYSCPSKGNYRLRIAQSKRANPKKYIIIYNLLTRLPWKFQSYDKEFCLASKQLYKYLKQFGKARDKFVPKFIKNLNPQMIRIFLNSYKLGDGCKKSKNSFYIDTSSVRMKDDLMELGIKAGFCVHSCKNKRYNTWSITFLKKYKNYWKIKGKKAQWIKYKGRVYDILVPKYHILLVRRNGKVIWSGNCDAYIFWRSKQKYKEEKEKSNKSRKGRKVDTKTNIPHMVFHRKK